MDIKNNLFKDCGYFLGGRPEGLICMPPSHLPDAKPVIIPWSELFLEKVKDGIEAELEAR